MNLIELLVYAAVLVVTGGMLCIWMTYSNHVTECYHPNLGIPGVSDHRDAANLPLVFISLIRIPDFQDYIFITRIFEDLLSFYKSCSL